MTINLDDILFDGLSEDKESLDTGDGLIADLISWSDKFMAHIGSSDLSSNTIRSYEFITSAIIDFYDSVDRKFSTRSSLSDLDANRINSFLNFLENYSINKEYGNIDYRLEILLRCQKKIFTCSTIDGFLDLKNICLDLYTPDEYNTFAYMIDSFADFMRDNSIVIKKLSRVHVKKYVDTIPKLSNTTMQQRKAALQSFLSYIDKKIDEDHFKGMYKNLNMYKKKAKKISDKKFALDEKVVTGLVDLLHDYPKNIDKYMTKPRSNSQYAAYKNTLLILIMMHGGCRAQESVSITFEDMEQENEIYAISVLGKGNKPRVVYIKADKIQEHLDYLHKHKGTNNYISGKPNGKEAMKTQPLFEFAKKMFSIIGSDLQGLHIFRHHFASNFAEKNGNIKLLQELLGHSNISTTMIYSDVREKEMKEAIRNL